MGGGQGTVNIDIRKRGDKVMNRERKTGKGKGKSGRRELGGKG